MFRKPGRCSRLFYKGFVDKADIIVFILIIGGAFWIVNDSKAFDIGTVSFLGRARKMENNRFLRKIGVENFLLTSIMLLFSIFGAVFGMSEETIAFCLVLVPMAISMGYDSITGVCMVFVAAGLGFAGAILNPFTIGIAQRAGRYSALFGIEYRIFCWIVINMIGFSWILRYAAKVKKNPKASLVYEEDQYWRDLHNNNSLDVSLSYATCRLGQFRYIGSHTNHFRRLLSCNNFTNREQRYQRTASPPHSNSCFYLDFPVRPTQDSPSLYPEPPFLHDFFI